LEATRPIETRERVAQFLFGTLRKAQQFGGGLHIELAPLSGETALIIRTGAEVIAAAFMHVESDMLRNMYIVINPDKLARI
jgi:RNA polymerase sigma-70 factor (ECF subfamily)